MYTNINTDISLALVNTYLCDYSFGEVPHNVIMAALTIIMRNNLFAFGDTFWLQLIGTAMSTSPAPDYTNIFFAVKEDTLLDRFP